MCGTAEYLCMDVARLTTVFLVCRCKNILSLSAELTHAEQKIQLPLSGGVSHHESAGHLSPRITHTYNLLSSVLLSSPVHLSSPLSTSCPLSLAFISSAGPADSWSRPGLPPPPPRGLKGAALEVEAPRPSGSLTCPQREASDEGSGPRTQNPPLGVRPGQTQPARH